MSRHHRGSGIAKGPSWERQRIQAFKRDGHRCTDCKKAGRLEVHHVLPLSEGGRNDLDNLKTLCRDCHISMHGRQITAQESEWDALVAETRLGV